jgi:hypothetical protein
MVRDAIDHSLVLPHKTFEVQFGCHRRFRGLRADPLESQWPNTDLYAGVMSAGCKKYSVGFFVDGMVTCSELKQRGRIGDTKKQKARLAAGLRGEKAPKPMRGWPQNPFLERSLVDGIKSVKQETEKSIIA